MNALEKLRTAGRNMAKGRNLENHEECNLLLVIADEIEAEVAERYIARPLDADGAPVGIGDELTRPMIGSKAYEVEELRYDGRVWWFESSGGCYACDCASHVKPDPLKELLYEFVGDYADSSGPGYDEECVSRYADRIRELMEVDR